MCNGSMCTERDNKNKREKGEREDGETDKNRQRDGFF